MRDDRYLGEIYHHGIKGMKWGVRRSPEQLGHNPKGKPDLAKNQKSAKLSGELFRSEKGFVAARSKLAGYCLKPDSQHSSQFFKLGYKESDSDRLFNDIEKGFDISKKRDVRTLKSGKERYSIPMKLGVIDRRLFRTVWQNDGDNNTSRFITAYMDRRLKEDD